MSQVLDVSTLPVSGKRVLVRVDFNVPISEEGKITDDTRIVAALPTIQELLSKNAAVILMSHLGRPKGKRNPHLSLAPCGERLSELLKIPVKMATDCVGPKVKMLVENLQPGEVMLLENLRFHLSEEEPDKDPEFAKELARFGDFYVNDAFGTAHRAHTSTTKITEFFPGKCAVGYLMEKELNFLGSVLQNPKHPFVALIGGAKISTKIGVLKALVKKADTILIGGAMAYTFFKARGIPIGDSLHENDLIDEAREIMAFAEKQSVKFLLPIDNVVADSLNGEGRVREVAADIGIPQGWQGVDIGPETIALFSKELEGAETVFWNGPMGIFEKESFAKGTFELAKAVAALDATTIVGGGDSVAAIKKCNLEEKINHISTGGGASLEYIEYGTLPGIEVLSSKKKEKVNC